MPHQHFVDVKPIPAFYCCYLLRSSTRHSSLYVGSTPDPRRRLAQHNGDSKGGAVRTSRDSLRPWEMICIVAGFPSNVAALQFEWAWHNAHLTRHIPQAERVSLATTRTTLSAKTGKPKKRLARPTASLCSSLANVHLLLRAPYFSTWPLELRFFSQEVYSFWQAWCQRVDSSLPSRINARFDALAQNQKFPNSLDDMIAETDRKTTDGNKGGLESIDTTFRSWKALLEKTHHLSTHGKALQCILCKNGLDMGRSLATMCPKSECESVNHLTCLSAHFLKNEPSPSFVPKTGHCPCCKSVLSWADLMKEMTLRTRGAEKVRKIICQGKRGTATDIPLTQVQSIEDLDEVDSDDNNEDKLIEADVLNEGDDDDSISVTSFTSDLSQLSTSRIAQRSISGMQVPIVIEDSDTDSTDVLDTITRLR